MANHYETDGTVTQLAPPNGSAFTLAETLATVKERYPDDAMLDGDDIAKVLRDIGRMDVTYDVGCLFVEVRDGGYGRVYYVTSSAPLLDSPVYWLLRPEDIDEPSKRDLYIARKQAEDDAEHFAGLEYTKMVKREEAAHAGAAAARQAASLVTFAATYSRATYDGTTLHEAFAELCAYLADTTDAPPYGTPASEIYDAAFTSELPHRFRLLCTPNSDINRLFFLFGGDR